MMRSGGLPIVLEGIEKVANPLLPTRSADRRGDQGAG
jgi:hypothetical protein